jgi:thiol-disulfide isomerase/thioredoxin
MIERLLPATGMLAFGLVVARIAPRLAQVWRARQGLGLPEYRLGTPAILYFTSPGCAPCESVQAPALDRLHAMYGPCLQVIEVDATLRPRLADTWGVLSVPTTFLIDAQGRPRAVNHGVARTGRLIAQLARLGYAVPEANAALLGPASAD